MILNRLHHTIFIAKICLLAILSCNAYAGYFSDHRFFYGVDVGRLQTQFKNGYGSNFFDDHITDYNVFFGAQQSGRFGFELGFSQAPNNDKIVNLNTGDSFPGTFAPLGPGEWEQWQSSMSVTSGYAGINWYKSFGRKLSLFALAGAEVTKMKIEMELLEDDLPGIPNNVQRTFTSTHVVPLVKLGVQYNFAFAWGMRFYYAWRNYSAFNPMKSLEFPDRAAELQIANSNSFYLGLFLLV